MHLHSMRSTHPLQRILFAFAGWLALTACVSAQSSPGWQTGQSTFNGSGYDLPPSLPSPAAVPVPESAQPTATDSLDLPADASGQQTSMDWNELPAGWNDGFGLSPAQLESPILDAPLPDSVIQSTSYSDVVASGQVVESPPLEEEVVSWYQRPWVWMTKGWKNHAEFGLDGSSGNADTLALQTGLEMKRKTDKYTLALDFDYRQASASDVITEDNGRFNLDYDRLIKDSNWSVFGKFGMEFDKFKSFDLRLNLNSGLGYYWIRNDTTNLVTRFGAGASKEIGSPDDSWIPEAVMGIEADHQLTSRQKVKAKLDFFPAWDDFSDYRLVTDVAWETLLSDSDNFSLRLSLTDRYDSTPQGALKNDFYYSALLLYKF
ncbi:putative mucin-like protein [Rhodopirellula islandica]|uniref:Mucin-like protein n=2 Tax=Rhodopirellula islandica TaxID=595434 RepID=A0A0J1EGM6_RHOIS|nr:putative mucin-like protein [Rhodopirellula islandica]